MAPAATVYHQTSPSAQISPLPVTTPVAVPEAGNYFYFNGQRYGSLEAVQAASQVVGTAPAATLYHQTSPSGQISPMPVTTPAATVYHQTSPSGEAWPLPVTTPAATIYHQTSPLGQISPMP